MFWFTCSIDIYLIVLVYLKNTITFINHYNRFSNNAPIFSGESMFCEGSISPAQYTYSSENKITLFLHLQNALKQELALFLEKGVKLS